MRTFGEQFGQSQGAPIEYESRLVHAIYRRDAMSGSRLRVRWVSAIDKPTQGISIKVKDGLLKVADTKAKHVVLWRDSSPDEVVLECTGRDVRELLVWNCWRDDRGVMHAWIGNAGMQLEETGATSVRVKCNSRPVVTFDDLVFELDLE